MLIGVIGNTSTRLVIKTDPLVVGLIVDVVEPVVAPERDARQDICFAAIALSFYGKGLVPCCDGIRECFVKNAKDVRFKIGVGIRSAWIRSIPSASSNDVSRLRSL